MKSKHRRLLGGILTTALSLSAVSQNLAVLAREESRGTDFEVSIADSGITIGNDKISRSFAIEDKHVTPTEVTNKKINRTLAPAEGSSNFVISAKTPGSIDTSKPVIENPQKFNFENSTPMDRSNWKISLTSSHPDGFTSTNAGKLIDGDLNTNPDDYSKAVNPWDVTIDLGEVKTVSAFAVDKRPGFKEEIYGVNGSMGKFELYTSENGTDWTKFDSGEFTAKDYNLHKVGDLFNVGDRVGFNFSTPQTTQYIKIRQLKSVWNQDKEEFTSSEINLYEEPIEQITSIPQTALDREAWTGSIEAANGGQFPEQDFKNLIDGDLNTIPDAGGPAQGSHNGYPINVDIDLGSEQTIRSFSLDKRPGFTNKVDGVNGTIGDWEIFASDDGSSWRSVGKGRFSEKAYNLHEDSSSGTTLYNVGDRVYANLDRETTTRYIRLQATSKALGTADEFTMAEFNLYEDAYQGPEWRTFDSSAAPQTGKINSSDLVMEDAKAEDTEDGVKLTISYEPYTLGDVTFDIDEIYVAQDGKDYLRSFIEVTSSNDQAVIDYIDQDVFVIPEGDKETIWTHPKPTQRPQAGPTAFDMLLGEPIYVDGMWMGSEFPVADTRYMEDTSTTQVRYYSGKTFAQMKKDNRLTTDGKFVSWQNVIGAARGTSVQEVQSDFFNYIDDIATPTTFRKQYNSWYDNMKNISDPSIEKSFVGVEDNLARNGVEPLDAYVVDDGWISYSTTPNSGNPEFGENANRTGFWDINDKFPNDFYDATELTNKLQSTFGVWIGPRGGYGSEGRISSIIDEAGTGYKSTRGDICVASHKYLDNFTDFAKRLENDYGVEYWKWDGFSYSPCTNAAHDHMVGGPDNMYYTSDMWEGWLDVFEEARAFNKSQGRDLFLNITCYVPLSPWFLQWANAVWIQDSGDTGQINGSDARHLRKIYYRDNIYWKLNNSYQVQFPPAHYYNHDPIYGVSDNSSATDADFRQYMFGNAMRGTKFWELYYSPSLFNDAKYEITADVLDFVETNQDVLAKIKMHGGVPGNREVYGYSAWTEDEGIVSFVNPTSEPKEYTLKLDAQAGVVEGMKDFSYISVRPFVSGTSEESYSFNDSITVTIPANDMLIYHFNAKVGTPELVSAKNSDNSTLAIKFNDRVTPVSMTIDGKDAGELSLRDDYRTVEASANLAGKTSVDVTLTVKDAAGNEKTETLNVPVYENGSVVDTDLEGILPADLDKEYDVSLDANCITPTDAIVLNTENKLAGSQDFSITIDVETEQTGKSLLKSGNDVSVEIDNDGFVNFNIKDLTLSSKEIKTIVDEKAHGTYGTDEYVEHKTHEVVLGKVNDGKPHRITASKAANGMLKMFIDGRLHSSLYDKSLIGMSLEGGELTAADKGFEGRLGRVRISNAALATTEIEASTFPTEEELNTSMLDRKNWTAEACSGANSGGDQGAAAAIDGDLGTRWHTNYNGADSDQHGHWIKVNFNSTQLVDKVYYVGRGGTINGSIKDYKLELLDANGEVVHTVEGTFNGTTDKQAVDVTKDGKAVECAGFKLTEKTTCNGYNYAAAVELYASGPNDPIYAADLEAEKAALIEELTCDTSMMTTDSANALNTLIDKIANATNARQAGWNTLVSKARAAKAALVDATKVIEAIDKTKAAYEAGSANYTEESWNAFSSAYEAALGAHRSAASKEAADEAAVNLMSAYDALETAADASKAILNLVIKHSETIQAELEAFKNGPAKEAFLAELGNAKDVRDTSDNQSEIDAAAGSLNNTLLELRRTPDESYLKEHFGK